MDVTISVLDALSLPISQLSSLKQLCSDTMFITERKTQAEHDNYKLTYSDLSTQLYNDIVAALGLSSMAFRDVWEYALRSHEHEYLKVDCYPLYTSSDITAQYTTEETVPASPHDLPEWLGTVAIWQTSSICVGTDWRGRSMWEDLYVEISTDIFMPHIVFPKYKEPDIGEARFMLSANTLSNIVPPSKLSVDVERKGYSCDIVFLIDCTGSMGKLIKSVKDHVRTFFNGINDVVDNWRATIVGYRDKYVDNPWLFVNSFTSDPDAVINLATELVAHGGGDGPETPLHAIEEIVSGEHKLDWGTSTDTLVKLMVLFTDADFKTKDGKSVDSTMNLLHDNSIHFGIYGPNKMYNGFFSHAYSSEVMLKTDSEKNYTDCNAVITDPDTIFRELAEDLFSDIVEIPDVDDDAESKSIGPVAVPSLVYDSLNDGWWAYPLGLTITCNASEYVDACKLYGDNGKTGFDTSFTMPTLSNFIKLNPRTNASDAMLRVRGLTGLPRHKHLIDTASMSEDRVLNVEATVPTSKTGGDGLGKFIHSGKKDSGGNVLDISVTLELESVNSAPTTTYPAMLDNGYDTFPTYIDYPILVYIGRK